MGEDDVTTAALYAELAELRCENARLRLEARDAERECWEPSASEASLRLAVAATGIGFWIFDLATGALEWSPRMQEIMGRKEPLRGEDYLGAVHPEDRDLARAVYERLRGGDETAWMRHRILRPDGEVRWVVPAGRIMRDSAGNPVKIIGGYLDVTELHHLEERVRQAERMDALATLTSGVAHNLNNLLAVIRPSLELTAAHVSEEGATLLADAMAAAERAARVIRQLMTFAGHTHITQSRIVLLAPLVESTLAVSRRSVPAEIQLDFDGAAVDAHVRCDPDELSTVLHNLILNARDALLSANTENPRINVTLTAVAPARMGQLNADTSHERVRLTVSDNGPGMPEHVKRRVFDPFFTTKGPSAGTGLGLAIGWSVVRSSGGSLECDSSPGQGSAFHVYLPVSGAEVRARESAAAAALMVEPLSILLVDDDHFVRRVTRRALMRARHSVTEAASAKEALSVAMQGRYDVVLLDQWLPDSCGTEIIEELRRLTPGAKIVLFSGQDVNATTTADALISKPMGARQLLDTLANLMS